MLVGPDGVKDVPSMPSIPAGQLCGLLLITSWPIPAEVLEAYDSFQKELTAVLPDSAYVYPGESLHCTIGIMRSFKSGPLDAQSPESFRNVWGPVLTAARASAEWPQGPFRLRLCVPSFAGHSA